MRTSIFLNNHFLLGVLAWRINIHLYILIYNVELCRNFYSLGRQKSVLLAAIAIYFSKMPNFLGHFSENMGIFSGNHFRKQYFRKNQLNLSADFRNYYFRRAEIVLRTRSAKKFLPNRSEKHFPENVFWTGWSENAFSALGRKCFFLIYLFFRNYYFLNFNLKSYI